MAEDLAKAGASLLLITASCHVGTFCPIYHQRYIIEPYPQNVMLITYNIDLIAYLIFELVFYIFVTLAARCLSGILSRSKFYPYGQGYR